MYMYIFGCVGLKKKRSKHVRALSDLSPYEENIKYDLIVLHHLELKREKLFKFSLNENLWRI